MFTALGCLRRSAAPNLKRANVPSGRYRRFRFTVTAITNVDDSMQTVQLTSLNLYAGGVLHDYTGAVASNPFGRGPFGSGPHRAIDGDTSTKWVDWECQPLHIDFLEPITVDELSFITADDKPECDPRRFRLEGFDESMNSWELLLDRTGEDFPATIERCKETPRQATIATKIKRPRLSARSDLHIGSCVVCLEEQSASHTLVPCGHQALCADCANGYAPGSRCPICRCQVTSVVKVFVASPQDLAPSERDYLIAAASSAQDTAARLQKEADESRRLAEEAEKQRDLSMRQREWVAKVRLEDKVRLESETAAAKEACQKALQERESMVVALQNAVITQRVGEGATPCRQVSKRTGGSATEFALQSDTEADQRHDDEVELISTSRTHRRDPSDEDIARFVSLVECSPGVARKALQRANCNVEQAIADVFA